MFLQTTTVLLLFMGCLLAAENSTTTQTLQSPTDSTAPGNRTTRTADSAKSVKNFVTKILSASSNPSKHSHPSTEPPKKNHESYPFHGPDGKPEYISHDTIHHAEIIYEEPSTEIIYQDHGNYYYEEPKLDAPHQQDIHQAIIDKEEFIQSEIHDLAHDIVETEYKKPEKPKGKPHPTSWKSLFSNIFPQGILNVFHLSVSGAPKEMKKDHVTYHTHTYATSPDHYLSRSNRMASGLATLPITTPIESTPKLLVTPPIPEPSPMPPVEQTIILESPTTQKIEQNQNATVMTNKDVYDINSAAEVSQIPVEVIPMESNNVFRIHAVNCDEKCNEESEDYFDEPLSEAGDDNAVAFSQEEPRNIFYPTPKSLPYDSNNFYYGTGTRTSEEIIQENNQKFGQKIIYHPAKQLDDFQKEVEKQFDHNEVVKIDGEANSRKFLKNFKGKYVRPQESDSVQSTTFKGLNHYQLVASTLRPEVTFVGQPSPVKPEGQINTYFFSAGFNSDKARESASPSRYGKSENGAKDETSSQNLFQPYSKAKPESLLHTYIFSSQDNNSVSETPSASTWQPLNSNSDTKENRNQLYSNTYSSTAIYESSSSPSDIAAKDSNENTVQPYSSNLKPESLLHTYIFAGSDNSKNNYSFSSSDSSGITWTPSKSTPSTPKDIIEIQKSIEVKHTKPYIYYNYPPTQPQLLSKNPIRVAQTEDSQQSESHLMPESYQQHQQYLQDLQKQLNQQQEYYQQQLIEQYQQKLHLQQQQQYLQNQRKHEEQLREYQQKQQEQLQQYQQQQKYQQQQEYQQQIQQQQIQQQQQNQQSQYYQQQQGYPKQSQYNQQENQQQQKEKNEKPQNYVRYNTVKVEKVVPKPYPVPVKEVVEKIIEKPVHVEHIVEKPVNVPYPVREVVEKIVDRPYPVEKIIDRPVHIPYPVQVDHFIDRPYAVRVPVPVAVPVPVHQYIDRPYPVEKIVEKPIHVPYPVDKIVEKIVEKHIPVEVERYIEKPAPAAPSKRLHPPLKKSSKPKSVVHTVVKTKATLNSGGAVVNNSKTYEDELLELVPPPIDQTDHDDYKTLPDDVQFVLIDDYNGPVPFDNQGYPWNTQEKRATKNHNTKRSPEFRRNLRVEYGFRPPLIPSVEIGEKGLI